MQDAELTAAVHRLRTLGVEPADVEVKASVGKLPKTVPETLSAFANGQGGTVLLGIDESADFTAADGFDAAAIRDALAGACADKLTPPIRDEVEVLEFEGSAIVRIVVSEALPKDKPCHLTDRGAHQGSFIRSGDGDRKLTGYEVTQLLTNTIQQTHDREQVAEASREHLDDELCTELVKRATERTPRAFKGQNEDEVLTGLGVLTTAGGETRPTLAGLLTVGKYPQQFFPQLFISFVVFPGRDRASLGPSGERFYDNLSLDGPIPDQLDAAIDAMRKHMSRAAIIHGIGREDRYDYPIEALREVFANALLHRDYSPESRGTQIQIELFPDRLEVRSPGGLYGEVAAESLGTDEGGSTSRNATLAKLLSDMPVIGEKETIVENRGTGLVRVTAALRAVGMSPPEFDVSPGHLTVTMQRTALLSTQTMDRINRLGLAGLSDTHHLAIAMMINAGRTNVAMLKGWSVPGDEARAVLKDLIDRRIAEIKGGRRYASYHLVPGEPTMAAAIPSQTQSRQPGIDGQLDAVVQALGAGHALTSEIASQLGLSHTTVWRRLRTLMERGIVERVGTQSSSKQSYRLIARNEEV